MKVTSFGEVLWDDFPSGKVLGGAPLNVLVRLRSLGAECSIISSRGDDPDGEELQRQIEEHQVSTKLLQLCKEQATSLVKVKVNDQGVATYDILYPCAWDRIAYTDEALQAVAESDAFIYGSLGTRDDFSRATLDKLLAKARFKIFDVNLRPPYYSYERLLEMMKAADMIKLNDDELYELAEAYGSKHRAIEQNIRFMAALTNTDKICVTLGGHGALYFTQGKIHHHGGFRVKVADTVGSGDSFLAGLTYKLLNDAAPNEALNFACALGAMVASHRGATPRISMQEIHDFINPV